MQRDPPPRPSPARGEGERAAAAMPEIAEARALLAALKATEEVKAAEANQEENIDVCGVNLTCDAGPKPLP